MNLSNIDQARTVRNQTSFSFVCGSDSAGINILLSLLPGLRDSPVFDLTFSQFKYFLISRRLSDDHSVYHVSPAAFASYTMITVIRKRKWMSSFSNNGHL